MAVPLDRHPTEPRIRARLTSSPLLERPTVNVLSATPRLVAAFGGLVVAGTVGGCGADTTTDADVHRVAAGDHSCRVEDTSLDAGRHVFRVENVGSDVTEVYVYGRDGEDFSRIVGERENIGPGTTQELTVTLPAGDYEIACKPGMTGSGIRTAVSVEGSGGTDGANTAAYDRELEFEVEPNGRVTKPTTTSLSVGQRIEFKLENRATAEYYLELLGPDGAELGEVEAEGGGDGEFVAPLADAGDYTVKVFRDGDEEHATVVTLVAATGLNPSSNG